MPFCYRQVQVGTKITEEVQTMKNINPKQYDIRFWRFVFTLLIQVILLMAVATGIFTLTGGDYLIGIFVVICCGFVMLLITRVTLVYIELLKIQLTIELKTIYGISLEKEIEEMNMPETEEEDSKAGELMEKGGSRAGRIFGFE